MEQYDTYIPTLHMSKQKSCMAGWRTYDCCVMRRKQGRATLQLLSLEGQRQRQIGGDATSVG